VVWRHRFVAPLLGERDAVLARLLEVVAVQDQLGAEPDHRRVLLGAVGVWRHDHDRHAVAAPGERQALAVVAARGRHDAAHVRAFAHHPVDVHESAANLERPRRRRVLVLDPYLGADRLGEQRPRILRGGRHRLVDDVLGVRQRGGIERHPPP
jgi:hypothetical protein